MKSTIISKIVYQIELNEQEAMWLKHQLTRPLPPHEDENKVERLYRKQMIKALTLQPGLQVVEQPKDLHEQTNGFTGTDPKPTSGEMVFGNTVFNAKWHKD